MNDQREIISEPDSSDYITHTTQKGLLVAMCLKNKVKLTYYHIDEELIYKSKACINPSQNQNKIESMLIENIQDFFKEYFIDRTEEYYIEGNNVICFKYKYYYKKNQREESTKINLTIIDDFKEPLIQTQIKNEYYTLLHKKKKAAISPNTYQQFIENSIFSAKLINNAIHFKLVIRDKNNLLWEYAAEFRQKDCSSEMEMMLTQNMEEFFNEYFIKKLNNFQCSNQQKQIRLHYFFRMNRNQKPGVIKIPLFETQNTQNPEIQTKRMHEFYNAKISSLENKLLKNKKSLNFISNWKSSLYEIVSEKSNLDSFQIYTENNITSITKIAESLGQWSQICFYIGRSNTHSNDVRKNAFNNFNFYQNLSRNQTIPNLKFSFNLCNKSKQKVKIINISKIISKRMYLRFKQVNNQNQFKIFNDGTIDINGQQILSSAPMNNQHFISFKLNEVNQEGQKSKYLQVSVKERNNDQYTKIKQIYMKCQFQVYLGIRFLDDAVKLTVSK